MYDVDASQDDAYKDSYKDSSRRKALLLGSSIVSAALCVSSSPVPAVASMTTAYAGARPWSYKVVGTTPPPTLEAFQEGKLASSYAQLTPLYKAVAAESRGKLVRIGVPDEALEVGGAQRKAALEGLINSLGGRRVYLDGGGCGAEVRDDALPKNGGVTKDQGTKDNTPRATRTRTNTHVHA